MQGLESIIPVPGNSSCLVHFMQPATPGGWSFQATLSLYWEKNLSEVDWVNTEDPLIFPRDALCSTSTTRTQTRNHSLAMIVFLRLHGIGIELVATLCHHVLIHGVYPPEPIIGSSNDVRVTKGLDTPLQQCFSTIAGLKP